MRRKFFVHQAKPYTLKAGAKAGGNGELMITNIAANGRPKGSGRVIIWTVLEIRYALSARAMILPSARMSNR